MTVCNLYQKYLDGDLAGDDQLRFEAHLTDCSRCAQNVAKWHAFREAMQQGSTTIAFRSDSATQLARHKLESAFVQRENHLWWRNNVPRPIIARTASIVFIALSVGILSVGIFRLFFDAAPSKGTKTPPSTIPITRFHVDGSISTTTGKQGSIIYSKPNEKTIVVLKNDRVAVGRDSKMIVKNFPTHSTQLELAHGWIACSVGKRNDTERFITTTTDSRFSVVVKGTRFGMHYAINERTTDDSVAPLFQVAVTEGVVEVNEAPSRKWIVRADEQLIIYTNNSDTLTPLSKQNRTVVTSLLTPKIGESDVKTEYPGAASTLYDKTNNRVDIGNTVEDFVPVTDNASIQQPQGMKLSNTSREPNVSIAEIKQWIGMGRYQFAIAAIDAQLKNAPHNGELWRLLAECKRKTENFTDALTAYQQVILYAPSPVANAARYKIGLIYQDHLKQPAKAIPYFSEYLTGDSQLLRAEALYHLGKAEYSVGRKTQAQLHLNEVVHKHGATAAAVQAQKLLQKMETTVAQESK